MAGGGGWGREERLVQGEPHRTRAGEDRLGDSGTEVGEQLPSELVLKDSRGHRVEVAPGA